MAYVTSAANPQPQP